MTQYINKDALVAEIEDLENNYKKCPTRNSYEDGLKDGRLIGYKDALHKINTLEVKEVDFDSNIRAYLTNHFNVYEDGVLQSKKSSNPLSTYDIIKVAKHFFELGLKVNQKGE